MTVLTGTCAIWLSYLVSLSSIAKALTVRTFPSASSATAVALATCACAALESLLNSDPNKVPPMMTVGKTTIIMRVSLGEIM